MQDEDEENTVQVDDVSSHVLEEVRILLQDSEFLEAATNGNYTVLAALIAKGTDLQQTDYLGRNALHLAVPYGNSSCAALLLKAGVNPTVKDNFGMTALAMCLFRRPRVKMLKLLFEFGCVVLPRNTPADVGLFLQYLIMTMVSGLTDEGKEIIKILLTKGCQINDPNAPGGRTALHLAAMNNNCSFIQLLVELGADIFALNHRNQTPRKMAITFRCKEAQHCLERIELKRRESTDKS